MSDVIDKANELADLHLRAAIYNAQKVTGKEGLTGFCRWCEEPTAGAFCSAACRRDASLRERNGR